MTMFNGLIGSRCNYSLAEVSWEYVGCVGSRHRPSTLIKSKKMFMSYISENCSHNCQLSQNVRDLLLLSPPTRKMLFTLNVLEYL